MPGIPLAIRSSAKPQNASMKISVVMSVFNGEAHVAESVDSILNQDVADFEFIVVDDGSTDSTATILDSYGDSRLQVVKLPANCGITTARNVGMALVNGEYLAVMDADDVAFPQRLSRQAHYLDQHPEVHILGARTVRVAGSLDKEIDRPQHPLADADIKARMLLMNGSALIHPTMMARMDFIREHSLLYPPPPRGCVGEDHEFWIKCIARGARFQSLADVLLYKRRHSGNVTLLNQDKTLARKKTISRAELLTLYFPELTTIEVRALAILLEEQRELSPIEAAEGIAAGEKALREQRSYYGESRRHLNQIVSRALSQASSFV